MLLLRGVFTRHRDHVVCHIGEFGALEFQSRRDETMHICILRRIIRESVLSHTRRRIRRGFIAEKAGHDPGKPRDIIDISRGIEQRFIARCERILRFRPRIEDRGKGGNYVRGRTSCAPVRKVFRKRKLHIRLFS